MYFLLLPATMLISLLLLTLLATSSLALRQGAPTKVCSSMEPFHGGGIPKQSTPSPFKVITFDRGNGLQVVVRSLLDLPFQGFMLQARTPSGELVGAFEPDPAVAHTVECGKRGDTVTHNNPESKNVVEAQWVNPEGYDGTVIFK